MPERDDHCSFAVINKSTGKCIAACHRNDGDTDCIGIKRQTGIDPNKEEVPLGKNLKLGRV